MAIERIQQRFEQLADDAKPIRESKKFIQGGQMIADRNVVDSALLTKWQTSVETLLTTVFGEKSPTTVRFGTECKRSHFEDFERQEAVLLSAKEQFEGGYLFNVRNLVHASIFSDELEQAEHFLESQYKVPAAVIAGTVLETTLRELCEQHPETEVGKADAMISAIAKQGIVNKMRADQLRAWMKIRNSAAHGKPDEFEDSDVARMIQGIRDFVAQHMN
jgi:hypothetical protein